MHRLSLVVSRDESLVVLFTLLIAVAFRVVARRL